MRFTKEDDKLLSLITAWGYLTVDEITLLLNSKDEKNKTTYWRVNRLYKENLILRQKTPYGNIFTSKKFHTFNVAGYFHYNYVKKLAHKLSTFYNCGYITDRQLRSYELLEFDKIGLTSKIPDLVLIKDNRKVAVEAELTPKSIKRLRNNIEKYIILLAKDVYEQVFYFADQATRIRIRRIAAEKGVAKIKTYPLEFKN